MQVAEGCEGSTRIPPRTECHCQDCKRLPSGHFSLVSRNSPLCDSPSCLYQETGLGSQMCFCDTKIGKDWEKEEYKTCDQVRGGGSRDN